MPFADTWLVPCEVGSGSFLTQRQNKPLNLWWELCCDQGVILSLCKSRAQPCVPAPEHRRQPGHLKCGGLQVQRVTLWPGAKGGVSGVAFTRFWSRAPTGQASQPPEPCRGSSVASEGPEGWGRNAVSARAGELRSVA